MRRNDRNNTMLLYTVKKNTDFYIFEHILINIVHILDQIFSAGLIRKLA